MDSKTRMTAVEFCTIFYSLFVNPRRPGPRIGPGQRNLFSMGNYNRIAPAPEHKMRGNVRLPIIVRTDDYNRRGERPATLQYQAGTSKYTPHQGARECARRIRQGLTPCLAAA